MPGWVWVIVATVGVVVLAVPVTLGVLLLARGDGSASPGPGAVTATATPPSPTPSPSPPSVPTDPGHDAGEGGLGGLFEDLLGGQDPMALARCLGTPTGTPAPLPEDPEAAIDAIAAQVASERGLAFTDDVDPALLAPADLADRVVALSAEDYPAEVADVDGRLLATLGAIPPGTDLRQLQLDLLGGQVAGFYDPDTGELTAVASDGLDPTARITLAHELDHALVDQAIGLPDLDGFAGRSDAALAALAVIEGDASLLMQRWSLQQLSVLDQLAAAMSALGPAGQLEATPWVLQQQLVFPYTVGLAFTCDRFAAGGGWQAVDDLYAAPPTTSAQVLWPERHVAGEAAVDVADPRLADGWTEVRRDQLGAADLLWLFQAPGDDRGAALSDPEARARAWAGGELAVGTRDEDTMVAVTLAEHTDSAMPLCDSMTAWYGAAFPDAVPAERGDSTYFAGHEQGARITCTGDHVELVIAPDAALD